ncbi:hypothetical protein J2R91_005990 [Bradyrhizobium japonicum]|nr:hypothetical protein [Bradyrhizobium japonicum]MCP1779478.1 hypothetical protein [Bradyrhizobium japonicum]MCP1957527.1 hypothetical protein [Bradyrhizobium japonicum]
MINRVANVDKGGAIFIGETTDVSVQFGDDTWIEACRVRERTISCDRRDRHNSEARREGGGLLEQCVVAVREAVIALRDRVSVVGSQGEHDQRWGGAIEQGANGLGCEIRICSANAGVNHGMTADGFRQRRGFRDAVSEHDHGANPPKFLTDHKLSHIGMLMSACRFEPVQAVG